MKQLTNSHKDFEDYTYKIGRDETQKLCGKLEDFAYVESVSEEKKAMVATHQGKQNLKVSDIEGQTMMKVQSVSINVCMLNFVEDTKVENYQVV